MGYNISQLPEYTSEQSREFMLKSILGAQTIDILANAGSFDPTAKGSQAIQLMDVDVYFQDGSTCGRNPMGGATLSQAKLTIHPIKINQNYCVRDLEKTYAVEDLKAKMKGANYDDALFLDTIGNQVADITARDLEKLTWVGDTTLSGTTNMKYADGFIKQIKAGSYINLSGATGSTVTAKLQKVFAGMPVEVSGAADFRIFIGQDTFNTYVAELSEKNLFTAQVKEELFGTTAKLEVVDGLNGTGHVVATRLRNLRAGGELDAIELEKWYSRETDSVNMDSRFSIGYAVVYPQEIGYTKFS
ncbi:hypothetical protein [Pedobacter agri]|uniref:hypothetical protein n=1 Tax=Pedobacter agri TaxID=454586 RepID=UPI00292E3BFB|nr:hypothetical protein [Pedobacter agri]